MATKIKIKGQGLIRLPFSGDSMWPFFRQGDELLVNFEKTPFETGDIVIVKDEHSWVSHRIVSVDNSLFLKGDFSTSFETIKQTQIWGTVYGIRRNKKSYIWGRKGHPLKSLIAGLSTMGLLTNQKALTRIKRWSSLVVLFLLSKTISRPASS